MSDIKYNTILVDVKDNVCVVTLNRPESLNSLNLEMLGELKTVVRLIQNGVIEARALLLQSAGRSFSSGADLMESAKRAASGEAISDSGSMLADKYHPLFLELAHLEIPVVSAVKGAAAGAGMSLAISADFVIAAKSGYFLQAFINIGLVPDAGSSWLLPRLIGPARARRMMMLGEKIPAETALDWGLCHSVCDDDDLEAEAFALASKLANGPTRALATIRGLMRASYDTNYEAHLQLEAKGQRAMGLTKDSGEGIAAFIAKRPADFKGE